jgi:uncharacterized protein (DUF427 family)
VALTAANGPFSRAPIGTFNIEIDRSTAVLFWEPVPQRVRAIVADETVADSKRMMLLHETGHLPVYYFPDDDLRADLLEESSRTTYCPHKGTARYWSVRVGDRFVPDAVWAYPEPIAPAAFLAGHVALEWDAFDEWFVEDVQAFGHPRDPYARIDVYETTRHVRVLRDGEVLADSRRAKVLFETVLPPRYYLPIDDIRTELLEPSPTRSRCAYKGSASYWHVRVGDRLLEDLVWSYPDPQHDGEPVRDLYCFFNERVDLELDGEVQKRPRTQYSRDDD